MTTKTITRIFKKEMKELLLLCTTNVHFLYNNDLYIQRDGIAMGFPLGPVIVGIFLIELEKNILPKVLQCMSALERYVDDTITYIKPDC